MSEYKKDVRNYKFSDAKMLVMAKIIIKCFQNDIADFTSFDSNLNISLIDDLSLKIQEVEEAPLNKQLRDRLSQKTNLVNQQMDKCRNIIQYSKYFIERAFPPHTSKLNEFGYNDYITSKYSTPKMMLFMQVFHVMLLKYKDNLLAAGYSQKLIDEVHITKEKLIVLSNDQQVFKKHKGYLTNERRQAMNKVWEIILHISKAGKIIFENDYGKYSQYVIYKTKSKSKILQKDLDNNVARK